jgi:hypothetical protein
MDVRIIYSAREHGVHDEDIWCVYKHAVSRLIMNKDPEKCMLFGYDTIGRPLEVGYFEDNGDRVIMHAMKCRKKYLKFLLRGGTRYE